MFKTKISEMLGIESQIIVVYIAAFEKAGVLPGKTYDLEPL